MLQLLLTVAVAISILITLILLCLPSQYQGTLQGAGRRGRTTRKDNGEKPTDPTTVQILVLGDIGRSPRMQYHASSIAKHGGIVELIGYTDSEPNSDIISNSRISIVSLRSSPKYLQTSNRALFLIFAPLKVIFQIWSLWVVLGYQTNPSKWMLVQNPPSIPTLAITQAICYLRHTRLIIDWHNFGYSILALKLGSSHPLVRISKWYEKAFGRGATAHFCVTRAMARILKDNFQCQGAILTLHDRPAEYFQPRLASERASILEKLLPQGESMSELLDQRSRLLVSSTSWTPDEDFSILLNALSIYSSKLRTTHQHLPGIVAVVTGKGPLKNEYLSQVKRLREEGKLDKIQVYTSWYSIQGYAALLACADLGVSLHTSSSGVDLPMKVVDMFGAGLPVVGWDKFEAWPELVTEGVNGKGFSSAEGLADNLIQLFGRDGSALATLKEGAMRESKRRWAEEWDPIAGKLLGLTT